MSLFSGITQRQYYNVPETKTLMNKDIAINIANMHGNIEMATVKL